MSKFDEIPSNGSLVTDLNFKDLVSHDDLSSPQFGVGWAGGDVPGIE